MTAVGSGAARRFQLILIKPSHYDDDGYVIRWFRSIMPSNSLAVLNGLALDCNARKVLGPDVTIDTTPVDEGNTRVRVDRLIAQIERHDGFGLVGLVGVQSNQYPRALDLAREFRRAGIQVIMGGFHVSGCLAMLDGHAVDLDTARELGVCLFAGEAEGRLDEVLIDAAADRLKPLYNYAGDLPALEDAAIPFLPATHSRRTIGNLSSFDAGRGCPFQCSFCTIINVQGRKSRRRSPDDVERIIRANAEQGVQAFLITDDNFARNKDWEAILDRIIELRTRESISIALWLQVDTLCHKLPNFIVKAKRAGVTNVFIGLENINPENLIAAKKRQNKITEYRKMLLAWRDQGILTTAGYILGFPADTPESIRKDIEVIKRELPIDIIEFFCLTPLPGSEDHQKLWRERIAMDSDLNRYDAEHVVTGHQRMTQAEWEGIYRDAWSYYYTPEHMETLLRRATVSSLPVHRVASYSLMYSTMVMVEGVHAMQGGSLRLMHPSERRPGLPRQTALVFYPKMAWDVIRKMAMRKRESYRLQRIRRRVESDPERFNYTDESLTPVQDDDTETLELLTHTQAAKDAVAHERRVAEITHGAMRRSA
jgi:radical SAM superfamily enzyme YgiQ (UPF0313 family)